MGIFTTTATAASSCLRTRDSLVGPLSLSPTPSRIVTAQTILIPGAEPSAQTGELFLWPGMSSGISDLVQTTLESWPDDVGVESISKWKSSGISQDDEEEQGGCSLSNCVRFCQISPLATYPPRYPFHQTGGRDCPGDFTPPSIPGYSGLRGVQTYSNKSCARISSQM